MTSLRSFASNSAASNFSLSHLKSSRCSLVSLTSCPTNGRSSGLTSFILFNTAVSSPFPRTATRIIQFRQIAGFFDLTDRIFSDFLQFSFMIISILHYFFQIFVSQIIFVTQFPVVDLFQQQKRGVIRPGTNDSRYLILSATNIDKSS